MEGWILFWKAVIIGTALAYFPLAVVVAVLGARDIKRLLTDISISADDAQSGKWQK